MYLCLSVEISYAVRSNTNNEETGQCDVSLGVRLPACLPDYFNYMKSLVNLAFTLLTLCIFIIIVIIMLGVGDGMQYM